MSTNKNAQLRYNVIDKCLSNFQRKHTYYTILEEVNSALQDHGYTGIKHRQLQEDIKFMESLDGFSIELAEDLKDGKKKVLRYKQKDFSIAKHPLNQLDKEQLSATITILSRYKHRAEFGWLEEFIPRMKQAFNLLDQEQTGVIAYQSNPDLVGAKWIGVLFNLIVKQKTAHIQYQPYSKEASTFLVHPYHLKQYNNRWFLLCKTNNYPSISTYSLDRINLIEESNELFEPTQVNWLDYFDEMIGVTKPIDVHPVKIELRFSEKTIHYINTKPLHGTQKPVKTDTAGCTIQIEVIPNFELYQTLLSFGPEVTVLKPKEVRLEMKEKINEMYKNYNHA
ncbi:helix-turn-helix transcriptional regulator [Psychroflexus aestuariivivens]|uniref:helix-turn-helix transcriptional regulator n=1 Tax=Psychroflexus aestuariivivens TaxID=1795040 RepID=UPI000FD72646|nr:WYL domain-containing protein [Psychroflexus aestuariivivens]